MAEVDVVDRAEPAGYQLLIMRHGIAVLRGNLAPDGAVMHLTG